MEEVFQYIDTNASGFIHGLLEPSVNIASVSAWPTHRNECFRMADWLKNQIEQIWPENSLISLVPMVERETLPDGTMIDQPPIILAELFAGDKNSKKTLLIYGHFDVQPAEMADGWETDPWKFTIVGDQMRGRGTTDDKGPVIGWLCMLKTYKALGRELPINIKLIFEGMEETPATAFDATAERIKSTTDFFDNVDYCVVSDNYWLSTTKPCVTHGLRGGVATCLTIEGPIMDLHSGSFGGQVYQPLDALIHILNNLKDSNEKILIPGIYDKVQPVSEEERERYQPLHFSPEAKKNEIQVSNIRDENDKIKCLMNVWRFPSLTIHGIEGAFSEPGFKTVIPRKVTAKFSIRTVPNMRGEETSKHVEQYIMKLFEEVSTGLKLVTTSIHYPWWYGDPISKVFEAASKATELVHKVVPDFTREGGSIPATLKIEELTGAKACLLPMGRCDDGAHSQNEKLDISNFINGIKVFCVFVEELSK